LGSPLGQAVSTNQRGIIEILLAHGADANSLARGGLYPLHMAARGLKDDVVGMLLNAKADPQQVDKKGKTARDYAIQQKV